MISIRIKSRKDLFMAKDNTKSKKGFTIIEVVLVLAIA
ncbi:prepilin-type N-terminal cleavage/methylation domain-containing protein, partial [Candidatus Saccharibacteria bacterium]|nr:prepilin-type N-terminal cleavage/methylation domain-containing protein [Candidatus Saccharibacteria bacterium]